MESNHMLHLIDKHISRNLNQYMMNAHIRFLLILILSTFLFNQINAQDLVESRRNSYYRFIYSINQRQAKQIHSKGLETVDQSFFWNLIDSIPLDSSFVNKLPQGDYLSVWVDNNQLHYQGERLPPESPLAGSCQDSSP